MTTISVQSVLYNNSLESLMKSLSALDNAMSNYSSTSVIEVRYGDASPSPILNEEKILELNSTFEHVNIKYYFFNENTGTAKGHNKLLNLCGTELVVIMNPDVIVCSDFFSQSIHYFDNEIIAIVESRQVPIEHPKQYNEVTGETDWAATACALIRMSDCQAIGGFDEETFFMYYDDVDFSWRIRQKGKKIIYNPDLMVFHAKELDNSCLNKTTSAERYYTCEGALLMAYKWSNDKLLKEISEYFKKSRIDYEKKAIENFELRLKNKQVPRKIPFDNKIATYNGFLCTKHRY